MANAMETVILEINYNRLDLSSCLVLFIVFNDTKTDHSRVGRAISVVDAIFFVESTCRGDKPMCFVVIA